MIASGGKCSAKTLLALRKSFNVNNLIFQTVEDGLEQSDCCTKRVRFAFPCRNCGRQPNAPHCRPAKHAAENTCTGPFVPFTIISEYFTNLIV